MKTVAVPAECRRANRLACKFPKISVVSSARWKPRIRRELALEALRGIKEEVFHPVNFSSRLILRRWMKTDFGIVTCLDSGGVGGSFSLRCIRCFEQHPRVFFSLPPKDGSFPELWNSTPCMAGLPAKHQSLDPKLPVNSYFGGESNEGVMELRFKRKVVSRADVTLLVWGVTCVITFVPTFKKCLRSAVLWRCPWPQTLAKH